MATSSIFHNIVINDPKKADAFVAALDASLADPYKRPDGPLTQVVSDKNEILGYMSFGERIEGIYSEYQRHQYS